MNPNQNRVGALHVAEGQRHVVKSGCFFMKDLNLEVPKARGKEGNAWDVIFADNVHDFTSIMKRISPSCFATSKRL